MRNVVLRQQMEMMMTGRHFALQVVGLPWSTWTEAEGAGGMLYHPQLRRRTSAVVSSEIESLKSLAK